MLQHLATSTKKGLKFPRNILWMSDLTRCNITFRLSSPDPVQNAGDAAWFFPSKDEYPSKELKPLRGEKRDPAEARSIFGAEDDNENDNGGVEGRGEDEAVE